MAITKATASSIAPAAKGSIVVGSATNDAGVLAVGTDTHILVADSAESLGMKWAAPAAGGGKVLQVVVQQLLLILDYLQVLHPPLLQAKF
jgi:hypothetical protein